MPSAFSVTCASCAGLGGLVATCAGVATKGSGAGFGAASSWWHANATTITAIAALLVMLPPATRNFRRVRIAGGHGHAELLRQFRIACSGDATDFTRRLDLVLD